MESHDPARPEETRLTEEDIHYLQKEDTFILHGKNGFIFTKRNEYLCNRFLYFQKYTCEYVFAHIYAYIHILLSVDINVCTFVYSYMCMFVCGQYTALNISLYAYTLDPCSHGHTCN